MGGILSLDPATRLGWSWAEPGEAPTWGNERLGRDGAGAGEVGAALCVFLEARLALFRPSLVIYEAPFLPKEGTPVNALTLRRLMGLPMLIDTICEQHGIECLEEPTLTFTRYFTGQSKFPGKRYDQRRKAKHVAVIAECHARGWMVDERDDDAAMALALLAFTEWKIYPEQSRRRPVAPGPLFAGAAA